jgi:hypothetical protein
MNEEFRRLGAFRGVLVIVVSAIAAVAGLASSGLSVAADDHAVATIRPEVPSPVATVPAAPRAAGRHRHRTAGGRPRLKHCRPVAGVEFTVSVGQRCPKALKHGGSGPHLSAKLRRAASRPRPALPAVTTTTAKPPATKTPHPAKATTPSPGKTDHTGTGTGGYAAQDTTGND